MNWGKLIAKERILVLYAREVSKENIEEIVFAPPWVLISFSWGKIFLGQVWRIVPSVKEEEENSLDSWKEDPHVATQNR